MSTYLPACSEGLSSDCLALRSNFIALLNRTPGDMEAMKKALLHMPHAPGIELQGRWVGGAAGGGGGGFLGRHLVSTKQGDSWR